MLLNKSDNFGNYKNMESITATCMLQSDSMLNISIVHKLHWRAIHVSPSSTFYVSMPHTCRMQQNNPAMVQITL